VSEPVPARPAPATASVDIGAPARARAFAGPVNAHLLLLEQAFGVTVACQGGLVTIEGADGHAVAAAQSAAREMAAWLDQGRALDEADVRGLIGFARRAAQRGTTLALPGRRQPIAPRTPTQARYLEKLLSEDHDLVFATGSAGTGKTFLAAAVAVAALLNERVRRIVVTRPAIEAGERLGFLPGDLSEKVDPYLQPIWDALRTLLGEQQFLRRREAGHIEVAPLAFMRGRTLSEAFVIVDEAQNATRLQTKMVLTRLGEGSRMVVTGDPTQVDLPRLGDSGLEHAIALLGHDPRVAVIRFGPEDVVRHPLVGRIVAAYDREQSAQRRDAAAPYDAAPPVGAGPAAPREGADDVACEVEIADPHWHSVDQVEHLVEETARATLAAEGAHGSVTVLLTDDAEMQRLNAQWRERDRPTNVLSFPAPDTAFPHLGDLALGWGVVSSEAHAQGKGAADHLRHLVVHGVLHLLGHDHEAGEAEAEEMEQRERVILAQLGVGDPYADTPRTAQGSTQNERWPAP